MDLKKKSAASKKITTKKALWGGRFSTDSAESLVRFSESISFDWRLASQDITGSIAHAKMLKKIGVLSPIELRDIMSGLESIRKEIEAGIFEWRLDREDVHMNIEAALTERKAAGAKLHTGRSRNDQVATDMRLWLRDQIVADQNAVTALQQALLDCAQKNSEVIIPGYTHLQRAQPVLLAHHLLAYVEMFERDFDRLTDCARRTNILPLGSGAIAGSTLPLDREYVAKLLGFSSVSTNSMDAVSDRDFILEYLSAAALIAIHLSRFSDELILWSTAEFNFIRIGDAYTTGSSLMPQKKNPDVAELTRGKSARVIGNLVAGLTLLKGLPLTYNRDFQEDKERLFDTADTIQACLKITAEMIPTITFNKEICRQAASDPQLLATDLADWLVKKGVPFRQAHHLVGKVVALGEKMERPINQLPLAEMKKISALFDDSIHSVFSLEKALASRKMTGAPNPKLVQQQMEKWRKIFRQRSRSLSF